MTRLSLFYNGKIYTQAMGNVVADSMAIAGNTIIAVGRRLEKDVDFSSYSKVDLRGHAILPGFVDSHTHLYFLVISMGNVKLDGLNSIDEALAKIEAHSAELGKNEWVTGEGFSPDRWKKYILPDKFMLDGATGGRPAAIFSKDQHLLWVNSKALQMASITKDTPEPDGGSIERLKNNEPSGILKEMPGYFPVLKIISKSGNKNLSKLYDLTLKDLYGKGVTGVHSFDGPDAMPFFLKMSQMGKLGLRINYYPPVKMLSDLKERGISFGYGNDYLRICGVKIFADGSLGSQSAYCFEKYVGSKNNYGIEANSKEEISKSIVKASRLNLPCAIHALGDRAVSNMLDCFEKAPTLLYGARHRIEHLQMIRRKDIMRLKRLGVTASMQPSHCPSDVKLIEKYWGKRGKNCFVFNTLLKHGIPLAFGSDAPIEPLDPLAGIDAAVNRAIPRTRSSFYPGERISVADAVFGFTAGAAYAVGQESERGFLLPGYKADFIILSEDVYRIPESKITTVRILATYFDGNSVFKDNDCFPAI